MPPRSMKSFGGGPVGRAGYRPAPSGAACAVAVLVAEAGAVVLAAALVNGSRSSGGALERGSSCGAVSALGGSAEAPPARRAVGRRGGGGWGRRDFPLDLVPDQRADWGFSDVLGEVQQRPECVDGMDIPC